MSLTMFWALGEIKGSFTLPALHGAPTFLTEFAYVDVFTIELYSKLNLVYPASFLNCQL